MLSNNRNVLCILLRLTILLPIVFADVKQREYEVEEFLDKIRKILPSYTAHDVNLLKQRKIKLTPDLITELSPHPMENRTSEKYSGFDRSQKHAAIFCCECDKYQLNCPVCRLSDTSCEAPYRNFSEAHTKWYKSFISLYEFVSTIATYEFPYQSFGTNYVPYYNNKYQGFFLYHYGSEPRCEDNKHPTEYRYGEALSKCTVVIPTNAECPKASIIRIDRGCEWSLSIELKLSTALKACIAPYRSMSPQNSHIKDDKFCSNRNIVSFPALGEYLKADIPSIPKKYIPRALGYIDDKYTFEAVSDEPYMWLNKAIMNSRQPFSNYRLPTYLRMVCKEGPHLLEEYGVYNGKPSWLGDIMIASPCSRYVPFDSKSSICIDVMENEWVCPDMVFKPAFDRLVTYETPIDLVIPHYKFNLSCNSVGKLGNCLLQQIANMTQYNLTVGLGNYINASLMDAVLIFVDALGRNDSTLLYRNIHSSNPEKQKTIVGNWFSGIFAALIEPFFDAMLSIIIKGFIPPLFDGFIIVLRELTDLITKLAEELLIYIKEIAPSLAKLINVIIRFIVGVLAVLESEILLFEYTLLFLILYFYIRPGNTFCLIIVTIAILVFGITRKSPSFILFFFNSDFSIFSLTHYRKKVFEYDYSINTYSSGYMYTFYFKNTSWNKVELY
ncbi:hypothetical protein [Halyomorpha halys negev-like virus 1]|uniref:Uncharacterized protein n=1 Tax=Halyomorpha halys negev-like virus 1 TaxID=2950332 RepID=A0AAE9LBF5_9VIRU|nr:hypothetical protein [Halyomorpha halys negev-like virus 1]